MQEPVLCQSCGMPMAQEADHGTEGDGSRCEDYCQYCYQSGGFTAEMTMDEMIAFCAEHVEDWDMQVTKEEAVAQMKQYFPQLKRWKSA